MHDAIIGLVKGIPPVSRDLKHFLNLIRRIIVMKKIALLLAAVMVAAMVPATAFAKTDNHVDKTVVVKKDTVLTTNAPTLKIDDREYSDIASGDQFFNT